MISSEAIFSDAWLMAGGYFLMFGYTIAMLGRWNRVEVILKILCDKEPAWWFWWQSSRSKGCPEPPKRMNFRKNSDGRGGHFQSKNLYYKIWTFKQGYLNMKLIQRGLFRLCFSTIVLIKIKTRYIFYSAFKCKHWQDAGRWGRGEERGVSADSVTPRSRAGRTGWVWGGGWREVKPIKHFRLVLPLNEYWKPLSWRNTFLSVSAVWALTFNAMSV